MSYIESIVKGFQDVRDLLYDGFKTLDIPVEPVPTEAGYFLMVDISKCKDVIPEKYLSTHDYEDELDPNINKNRIYMDDGRIPLDLAFCRWIAVERGVIMMPNILFYHKDSPFKTDTYVRVAISRGMDMSK